MSKHIVTEVDAEILISIYYNPEHLWIGRKAIKLLAEESKLSYIKSRTLVITPTLMATAY